MTVETSDVRGPSIDMYTSQFSLMSVCLNCFTLAMQMVLHEMAGISSELGELEYQTGSACTGETGAMIELSGSMHGGFVLSMAEGTGVPLTARMIDGPVDMDQEETVETVLAELANISAGRALMLLNDNHFPMLWISTPTVFNAQSRPEHRVGTHDALVMPIKTELGPMQVSIYITDIEYRIREDQKRRDT